MKPQLVFIAAAGLIAVAVRALGPAPLADVAALTYLAAATLRFGSSVSRSGALRTGDPHVTRRVRL